MVGDSKHLESISKDEAVEKFEYLFKAHVILDLDLMYH